MAMDQEFLPIRHTDLIEDVCYVMPDRLQQQHYPPPLGIPAAAEDQVHLHRCQQKMLDQLLMSLEGPKLRIGVCHSSSADVSMSVQGSVPGSVRPA